jgi:hypothetical protein
MSVSTVHSNKESLFTEANCKALEKRSKLFDEFGLKAIELAVTELRCYLTESGAEKVDSKVENLLEDTELFKEFYAQMAKAFSQTAPLCTLSTYFELLKFFDLTPNEASFYRPEKEVKKWLADNPEYIKHFGEKFRGDN